VARPTRSIPKTREERALLSLGRAAEAFVAADRQNREAQHERRRLKESAYFEHLEATPCFEVFFPGDPDEEAPLDEQFVALPVSEWCDACQLYAKALEFSSAASYKRGRARRAMIAAFRRLTALRQR
jgi:hypothetical protein